MSLAHSPAWTRQRFAEPLAAVLRQPLWAAQQSGRPVVLVASNTVPLELVHAAGCFPLQLPTAPRASTTRADQYLEARFDPLVRSALEQLLAGELDLARLIILPRTDDSWQRLYYYLCELSRSFGARLPEPYLYDLLHTPFASSADYNHASTRALAEKLGSLSGIRVSQRALAESITLYNRVRSKLTTFLARRHARPCQLAGADALELYTAAQRLDPAVLEAVLDRLLGVVPGASPGVRTLLVGSAHDTPALHQLIARAGGQVVADYQVRGDLSWAPAVPESAAPLHALSEHYHRASFSPRTFPAAVAPLLELAERAGAEAAVFFYYAEEEALTWEYPAQRAALEALGIPSVLLAEQAYPPSDQLALPLQQFYAPLAR